MYKRYGMSMLAIVLGMPWVYKTGGMLMRRIVPFMPRFLVFGPWNPWGLERELPPMPKESFRDLLKKEQAR